MVEDKDIVLAVLGGSLSVSGLLLVFLGFTLSAYVALDSRDIRPAKMLGRLKNLVWGVIVTVILGVTNAGLALIWLLDWGSADVIAALFFMLLGSMVVVTGWTARVLT